LPDARTNITTKRTSPARPIVPTEALVTSFVTNRGTTRLSTNSSLPLVNETISMRYYHEPGDTIDVPQQEGLNTWAIERLMIVLPQKVECRKYVLREAMGRYTGNGNAYGFTEPSRFRFPHHLSVRQSRGRSRGHGTTRSPLRLLQ